VTKIQIRVEDGDYFQEVVEKVKNTAQGAALATLGYIWKLME
jgi:hypothetical protein